MLFKKLLQQALFYLPIYLLYVTCNLIGKNLHYISFRPSMCINGCTMNIEYTWSVVFFQSVRSSRRKDQGKGRGWGLSLFQPAACFILLENIKIQCKIQESIYPFLYICLLRQWFRFQSKSLELQVNFNQKCPNLSNLNLNLQRGNFVYRH